MKARENLLLLSEEGILDSGLCLHECRNMNFLTSSPESSNLDLLDTITIIVLSRNFILTC